jgi:copper homeostasis protein
MIRSVREAISIGLHVMIRPRPGDFCYSDLEFDVMMRDIEIAKRLGVDGVVMGVLRSDRTVDVDRTKQLLHASRPLSVTFHRAIDDCLDVTKAFDDVARLGIDRVLTSGGKTDVLTGADVLRELVQKSHGKPKVLAGGGVSFENVVEVVTRTGVREVHALSALSSEVEPRGHSGSPGQQLLTVDSEKVRMMVQLLSQIPT